MPVATSPLWKTIKRATATTLLASWACLGNVFAEPLTPSSPSPVGDLARGFTLFTPLSSNVTYLIDDDGAIVHNWVSAHNPGLSVYLLDRGRILRTARIGSGAGAGGRIELIGWNGTVLWTFDYAGGGKLQHHDIEPLPNGNILMIAWEDKTREEAIAQGRDPDRLRQKLSPLHIIEVKPSGTDGGEIVWEWHLWDHLIQDFDETKENYGVVAKHPELVDINFAPSASPDWIHANSIDYNPELDQILVSSRHMNEIWIIDHSTTTEEAAGHTGGRSGMGGDLLYRWGNPQSYRHGDSSDQTLFGQHNAQWIEPGLPGEGKILLFNNGLGRPQGLYSSIEEIKPPVDENGHYWRAPGASFEPQGPSWIYTADEPTDFYASYISGTQRLPNGNTLVCCGPDGYFFEVNPEKKIVWQYTNRFPRENQNQVFRATRHYLYRMN